MLSPFDEKPIYNADKILVKAINEIVTLRDRSGHIRDYIDFNSAYGSCNFGHCNPDILRYIKPKADVTACFYPEEAYQYATWITDKLSLVEYSVLYQVGGSHAVSAALSISQRIRPGKIIYVKGSFHGLGLDALSVTSVHKNFALQNTQLISALQNYSVEIDPNISSLKLEEIFSENNISAFIFEPIQGANGYVPLPLKWLKEVIRLSKKYNIITIADEIQCGYFRHGHLSISIENGLLPDILLFSKSMTNGQYPFSVVIYPNLFNSSIKGDLFLAHTFQTSALGCYAAMSVAKYIDETDLSAKSNKINEYLEKYRDCFCEKKQIIKDLYITGPTLSFTLIDRKASDLVKACLARGILIFTGGKTGDRIRFAPPLVISEKNLEFGLTVVLNAL